MTISAGPCRSDQLGRARGTHQKFIDGARGLAAFANGPDDEGLALAGIACGKDLRNATSGSRRSTALILVRRRARGRSSASKAFLLRTGEADGEEHELRLDDEFGAGKRLALLIDAGAFDAHRLAVLADDAQGGAGELAGSALGLAAERCGTSSASRAIREACFPDRAASGVMSSWVTLKAPWRKAVPMQSDAVSPPPMTTTFLPVARSGVSSPIGSPPDALVLLDQEGHGDSDSRRSSKPGICGSRGRSAPIASKHRVVVVGERAERAAIADIDIVVKSDAFGLHLRHAKVDAVLFHLEIGNAVAQAGRPPWPGARRHAPRGRRGPAAGRRQVRPGPEPTMATRLPVCCSGGSGSDPAFAQALSAIACSMLLMVTGTLFEIERAGLLARSRADAAGKLREIVGRVEVAGGLAPVVLVDEIVPVGDLVVHRTARVAIGDAAIHAARRLLLACRGHRGE